MTLQAMNRIKLISLMMAGVLTGLVIGILFAPYKGSKTRKKIAEKSGELSDGIKNQFHRFGEFIHEKLDGTKWGKRVLISGKSDI